MGLFCEINLAKPADGAYTPGSTVSGVIKYVLDEPAAFNKITVSLKGNGHLSMKEKMKRKRAVHTHRNHEYYIDVENAIHNDEKAAKTLAAGSYETKFKFTLPEKIPPSLQYLRTLPRYVVRCNIKYYIRIKFERPGLLKFDKKFQKEISVVSGITPRLPTVPTICGEQKVLTHFFSNKKGILNIKATIQNCVIKPSGTILLNYEVENNTNVVVKGVETKLIEVYNFTSQGGREYAASDEVKDTDSKTGSIKSGETKTMDVEIVVPPEKVSLDYSRMVTRDYIVKIIVNLPLPHRDAVLEIPVQIGDVDIKTKKGDAPPTYWEAMSEEAKRNDDDGDNDDDVEVDNPDSGSSKS